MIKKKITAANVNEQIKQLYQTAFPENEQIPWDDLIRLIGEMNLDFTAYYEDDNFIGFTIVYPRTSFNWYWYFAVRPELRGLGKGQQILTALLEKYKGHLVFWIWSHLVRSVTTRNIGSTAMRSISVTDSAIPMSIAVGMT